MRRVSVIVVAAGEGKRFGSAKQFALLRGRPLLDWCLEKFIAHPAVNEIVVVLPDEKSKAIYLGCGEKITAVVTGGPRRQDSVRKGLEALDPDRADVVLVHDGVRPFVSRPLISRVIEETRRKKAVIPAIPVEDTIKEAASGQVVRTLDRERLCRAQTPQGFLYSLLKKAFQKASEEGFAGTDEAALVERIGVKVAVVAGEPGNIKVTTARDLKIAEAWLDV
ncbi:MAG: 2-C-methyl-D-erythritol 4-phosphate cytidylyltransferase [Candidatus Aminicenantes bacterium]|nr:2-C-methyl-D-erythritol 4-phosphate cytidylyltransferase [Candidatus Aminicenantes bacterium]